MIYRNTLLSSHLQSPMQIISSRATRSTLPLSNVAKRQMGIQNEKLRWKQKNQHLPTHDFCLNQTIMYQEPSSKIWYLTRITKLCEKHRSYNITTEEGTQYRKMQMHLKPYQPRHHTNNRELKTTTLCNDSQIQLRPRIPIKPPKRLQIVNK